MVTTVVRRRSLAKSAARLGRALGSTYGDRLYERAKAATGGRRELAAALGRGFSRLG